MTRLPLFLALLFFSLPALAQVAATVAGRVVDEADEKPLPYAEIALTNTVSGTLHRGIS